MTTLTPLRFYTAKHLVNRLRALNILTPRNQVAFTYANISKARQHGNLVGVKYGTTYVYTEEAVAEWIAGGCQTGRRGE